MQICFCFILQARIILLLKTLMRIDGEKKNNNIFLTHTRFLSLEIERDRKYEMIFVVHKWGNSSEFVQGYAYNGQGIRTYVFKFVDTSHLFKNNFLVVYHANKNQIEYNVALFFFFMKTLLCYQIIYDQQWVGGGAIVSRSKIIQRLRLFFLCLNLRIVEFDFTSPVRGTLRCRLIVNAHSTNTGVLVMILMTAVGVVFLIFTCSALCYRHVVVYKKNPCFCFRLVKSFDLR